MYSHLNDGANFSLYLAHFLSLLISYPKMNAPNTQDIIMIVGYGYSITLLLSLYSLTVKTWH